MSITQNWLAQGNRFDDIALWERLCFYLDLQPGKSAYVRDLPAQFAPLLYDSHGAQQQRDNWDRFEICPVFFLRERGWCLHTDWVQRLALLRSKDATAIATQLRMTVTKREAKFVRRMTTGVAEVAVCDLCRARGATPRAITHQPSCLIATLRGRIAEVESGRLKI